MARTIKQFFWSMRPVAWINTAFLFGLSYFVVKGNLDQLWVIGTLYFLIPYNLIRYGSFGRRHRIMSIFTLLINVVLLIFLFRHGTLWANIILSLVVFAGIAFRASPFRLGERPFLDVITSAIHFTGPMLYAIVLTGWDQYYLLFVMSFFLWTLASHAFGAVQYILPQRENGHKSTATVLGARWTVRAAIVLYLMASEMLLLKGTGPAIVGGIGLLYVLNILPYWDLPDAKSRRANTGWRRFLALNYLAGTVIALLLIVATY